MEINIHENELCSILIIYKDHQRTICALLYSHIQKNWVMWTYFLKTYQQTVRSVLHLLSVHYHLSHLPPFRLVTSSHIRFASFRSYCPNTQLYRSSEIWQGLATSKRGEYFTRSVLSSLSAFVEVWEYRSVHLPSSFYPAAAQAANRT